MTDKLVCDEHGDSEATFVCTHIIQTLDDAVPRGFNWSLDRDGEYQAACSACRSLSDAEWERVAGEVCTILCLGCFKQAASLNGITIGDGDHV